MKLPTDIIIKHDKRGEIKSIKTPYENDITYQPFDKEESYVTKQMSNLFKTFGKC